MSDDARLRELAEAADAEWHEGQWYTAGSGELLDLSPADRRHIAAASPRTILRLLDELDELRQRCEIQQTELEVLRRPSRYGGEGGLVTIDLRDDDER